MHDHKRFKIPFRKQVRYYYCGPAVIQMVLEFYGTDLDQEYLAKILMTDNDYGTRHRNMMKIINKYGLHYHVQNDSKLEDIFEYTNKNIPVIVHYIEPSEDEGHYAIVSGQILNKIILNDPWNGENFTLNKKDFVCRWHDTEGNFPKWFIAIYKKRRAWKNPANDKITSK